MPELPEVETVRRGLEAALVGRTFRCVVVRDARLRYGIDAERMARAVQYATVVGVRRRAKYLLIDLHAAIGAERVLLIHLGMSGTLRLAPPDRALQPHDHVLWQLDDGLELRLCDPRRFGSVDVFERTDESEHPRLRHLGAEPLDHTVSGAQLRAVARGRRMNIKTFVMDARHIVGIGNIYACESLFRAGLRPTRSAGRVRSGEWDRLVAAIRDTLRDAIAQGGTTLRDFRGASGERGYFAVALQVYGRTGQPCRACRQPIRMRRDHGRSTFYCSRCQR